MSNIKFFGFGKEQSSMPVYGLTIDKNLDEQLTVEVPKMILRLQELELAKEERQRIKSEYGVWFCKRDDKGFLYYALCVNIYPERHIYAAIGEVRTHLATIGDYPNEPDVQSTLKLHTKGKLVEICEKYNNTKTLDKVGYAGSLMSEMKDDISESTRKLMDNQVNLEGLETKATSLRENAQIFESSSAQVERQMYCRNCKMKVIIGLVIIALICVIVIPIVTKA